MGSFITNFQVRADSTSAVRQALAGLAQARAYVSPPMNGWVTVYDEASDGQDSKIFCGLAQGLSKKLTTAVFAFLVHDSDIAAYWLYQGGTLVDEFDSNPEYFGEAVNDAKRQRVSGKAEALLPLCLAGTTRAQVETVIHPPDGPPLMAEELLVDLAKFLGIDEARVSLGFKYFEDEGEEILPDIAEFEPFGKGAGQKAARVSESPNEPAIAPPDIYDVAVGMITQCWNPEHEKNIETAAANFGGTSDDMFKKLRSGFDRGARDMLKHSKLPGLPAFEELQAARDQGPETLATLIAQRTPGRLADIGVGAVMLGSEQFIAALLKQGLDPNAKSFNGRTSLSVAEQHLGKDSKIFQLLKSASKQ